MIETISDFLFQIKAKEEQVLAKSKIKHGPTIGAMYEGLGKSILERAIPLGLDLKVTSGFIHNGSGLSPQIDCMVTIGKGEKIPYLESEVYPTRQVLAVLELKKTLYTKELIESVDHLDSVRDFFKHEPTNPSLIDDAVSGILGFRPSITENEDSLLNEHKSQVYACLEQDAKTPARIALGFFGFNSEKAFRNAWYELFSRRQSKQGFTPASLPDLVISGQFSVVKNNGMPCAWRSEDEEWLILGSGRQNPVYWLLQIIWTRLDYTIHNLGGLFGDDLQLDALHRLLDAKFRNKTWIYNFSRYSEQRLSKINDTSEYSPTDLSPRQAQVLALLLERNSFEGGDTLEFKSEIDFLIAKGIAFEEGDSVKLLTKQLKILLLPDGRYVAGDDVNGRLMRWCFKKASL